MGIYTDSMAPDVRVAVEDWMENLGVVRSIYVEENTLNSKNDKTELAIVDYAVDKALYTSIKDRIKIEVNAALKNNTGNDQRGYFMRAYLGPDANNLSLVWAGDTGSITSGAGFRTFDINLYLQRRGDTQIRMRGISEIGPLESENVVSATAQRAGFNGGVGFGNITGGKTGGYGSEAYNVDFSTPGFFHFRLTLQNSHIDPNLEWLRDRMQVSING